MNCSTTADIQNRNFLNGNFGASVFMATYIGIYGMGLIVYFACQFITGSRDNHDHEIPSEFFPTFHYINEREEIYSQLSNENWVKELYKVYYSDVPHNTQLIEGKANECSKKYHKKMQHLKSRYKYYVIENRTSPIVTTASRTNQNTREKTFV